MAGIEQYIPPNLRRPIRDIGSLGYSLLDNVVGIDDGYDSAGERLGRQVRENPVGMAKAMGGGLLSGAANAVMNPIDTVKGVASGIGQSYSRASRGADSYLPDGVDLASATVDQMRAANDAYLADVVGVAGVVPAARAATGAARMASNIDTGALAADTIGLGRSIGSGDLGLIGEVLQQSGEAKDLSAARVKRAAGPINVRGSDYFAPAMLNAGRTRDEAMYTPFSGTKHITAPYDWITQGSLLGENFVPESITPSTHQGTRMFFAAGDRTAGDMLVEQIGKTRLRRPVTLRAGGEYMDTGDTWASHSGVMKPKDNVLQNLSADGKEKIGLAFMPMGERSGDFAVHQSELVAEMLYSSPMPRASIDVLNERVMGIVQAQAAKKLARENKKRVKDGLDPLDAPENLNVPSVESEGFRDWLMSQTAEGVRKPLILALDTSPMKALDGVPDIGEIRFAATNPELVGSSWGDTGFRFGTPDIERGLLPSNHPSYDTKYASAPDTGSQTYGFQVPWTIAARDTALPRLAAAAEGKGTFSEGQNQLFGGRMHMLPSEQRVFTMNPKTSQMLDQQYVDEASTYGDVLSRGGKAEADRYERGLLDAYLRGR